MVLYSQQFCINYYNAMVELYNVNSQIDALIFVMGRVQQAHIDMTAVAVDAWNGPSASAGGGASSEQRFYCYDTRFTSAIALLRWWDSNQ